MLALTGVVLHKLFPPHMDKSMQKPLGSDGGACQNEAKCLLHVDGPEAEGTAHI